MNAQSTSLPLQERVEAQGHLIDSHIMEQIFDTVVELAAGVGEQIAISESVAPPVVETLSIGSPTKKQVREKRVTLKKRSEDEAKQEDLWG